MIKTQLKHTKAGVCSVWRRRCDRSNVSEVVAKFRAGGFSLDDAPQLGNLAEVDSDQIETLIENNQCPTMREIADTRNISKSIQLLVKMKNVSYFTEKNLNELFGPPNISTNSAHGLIRACFTLKPHPQWELVLPWQGVGGRCLVALCSILFFWCTLLQSLTKPRITST